VAGSAALAVALIQADTSGQWQARWPRLFGASAAGARGMLSRLPVDNDRGGRHVFDGFGDAGAGL